MFCILIVIVALAQPLLAAVAYDCSRPSEKITFSLLDTGYHCFVADDQPQDSDEGTPDPLRRSLEIQKCELGKMRRTHILAMAPAAPNEAAFNIMGPGWAGLVIGENLHVIKCTPVDVEPQPQGDDGVCYNEIPVKFQGRSLFITAKTRFLLVKGTQVPCIEDFMNGKVKRDSPVVEEWTWEGVCDMFQTIGTLWAGVLGIASMYLGMERINQFFINQFWPCPKVK